MNEGDYLTSDNVIRTQCPTDSLYSYATNWTLYKRIE